MASNITFTGVLNFNYAPKVVEVDGIPSHHPVKESCQPCYGMKVKCSGHNDRARPCHQCMTRPSVECFFTRSKRPVRRGANNAAVPAAFPPAAPSAVPAAAFPAVAAPALVSFSQGPVAIPAAPPAIPGFPAPPTAMSGPLGVATHGANPADLAWGTLGPFPGATNLVQAAAAAPAASISLAPGPPRPPGPVPPSQSRLRRFGCEIHRDLYDEPLELSRLVNAPQHAAVPYSADSLLGQNSASLRSCWLVVDCPRCVARPEVVAATYEVALEMYTIYERVARIAANPEPEPEPEPDPTFPAAAAVVSGPFALPSPPPSPLLPLPLRLSRDAEEFDCLAERVAVLLAPYDQDGAVELWNRAKNLRVIAGWETDESGEETGGIEEEIQDWVGEEEGNLPWSGEVDMGL
ncbi:hypothetical protein MYCTH_93342 [Thermothelomyces thermophilus ATCC 42464]|uniref:Zn(2)-C6 fungal-type domain-containing protein n=1 Tax=Thermothelomyces thermophilus (strain ATCC 42464 / BCRC 31852 / DSM 1799) TaxID=573729 RepID=G2QAI6_THET4|nr:uncharacterized protein MYCTH_93342 [Thermothelomyces thermophilus ATCC 42464]AEO55882.1 hypothetical protein MYCTH_93342 [Thermothelomyces thermophilus ATCC 42464]